MSFIYLLTYVCTVRLFYLIVDIYWTLKCIWSFTLYCVTASPLIVRVMSNCYNFISCVCLPVTIVWLFYLMFGDKLIFWYILSCLIIIVRTSLKMTSSSSLAGRSKRKDRLVGPISIDDKGCPYGPHYDALIDRISRHVCHADEFPPDLTWPDHKKSGRVQRLYLDMAVSYFNI